MSDKFCICFARVSTQSQDLTQQTNSIISEAQKLGYDDEHRIIIEYKESAICLAEDERAGIESLKKTIEENQNVDCVIVWELSRLARRADVMYSIRDYFLEKKINLVCMTPYMRLLEGDGKMSQTSSIMLAIFTSIAESEMAIKKERMRRGIEMKKEKGQWIGGKLRFGYKPNKFGYFIIDENEAEIVKWIYEKYSTGKYSTHSLGLEMMQLGIREYQELSGYVRRVWCTLSFNGYDGSDPKFPAIISKELNSKVKSILKENSVKHLKAKHSDSEYLLKGIIREKETNRLMYGSLNNKGYTVKGKSLTPFNIVHPLVWEECKKLYKGHTENDRLKIKLTKELSELVRKYEVCVKKVYELEKKIDFIEERLINGRISEAKADEMENETKKQIRDLKQQMLRIQEEEKGKAVVLGQIEDNLNDKDNIVDLDAYDNESRKKLIKQVIKVVYVTRVAEEGSKEKNITCIEIHNNYNNDIQTFKFKTHKNRYKGARYEIC